MDPEILTGRENALICWNRSEINCSVNYRFLENTLEGNTRLKQKLDGNTVLTQAADAIIYGARRENLLFDDWNKRVIFLSFAVFSERIRNIFSVFLSSYRNTRKSLGKLVKVMKTLPYGSCSHSFLRSPKIHACFYLSSRFLFKQ